MTTLDSVHEMSRRQLGLVLVGDLYTLGCTRDQVRHLVGSRRLERLTRRVLRDPGAPRSERQRVLAGVLDASPAAAACATTAAAVWGVVGFDLVPVHVVRSDSASGRRSPLVVHHQFASLRRRHVTVLDGIPVVRPEVVVLQLCDQLHPQRAAAVLDNLWRRRLTSGPSLRLVLDDLAGSGRNGVTVMRELLDARGDDYVPPASGLEGRFEVILRRAGESPMRRQVDTGGELWIGRVDFRDLQLPLLVEIQSEAHHSALVDREHDARRLAALRAEGFEVIEVTDRQVWHRPDDVVAAVRAARQRLRAAA
jgi:very-short-patch-repair endonuclease